MMWPSFRSSGLAAACCAVALLSGNCAARSDGPAPGVEPDKFLIDRGQEALMEERWLVAREYLVRLQDSYPQSAFRADAKLGVGDSYLGENTVDSLVQATNEFREFLAFFPTNPRADYAQYQLGNVHFQQMRGPERDQTETKEAIREYELFVERYPTSALMPDVQARLRQARDRLSDADYQVGLFYSRIKWLPGAVERFKTLLLNDPGYTRRDAVYFQLADALVKSEKRAEALPYYERLLQEFEQSEYLEETRRRVEELKAKGDQAL